MSTRRSLTTTFILCSFLLLSPNYADISWIHDEVAEENQDSRPRRGTPATRAARQPDIHQLSEAFGHFIGQDISKQGIHLDINDVITGIHDGVQGKPAPLSEQEYDSIISNFRSQHFQELANFNLALADAFMLSNGKRSDIVQAAPGKVQFVILQRGHGPRVEAHTVPILRFVGRFIDGTIFTQTEDNKALPVPLDDMIPGFRLGVVGMQEGEKRRIFIHPDAAYGTTGNIAPNSLLLFEVEVVKADDNVNSRLGVRQQQQKAQGYQQAPVQDEPEEDDWDLTLDNEEDDEDDRNTQPQAQHRSSLAHPVAAVQTNSSESEDDDDEGNSLDDWDELQPQQSQNPPVSPKQPQSRYYFHPHR